VVALAAVGVLVLALLGTCRLWLPPHPYDFPGEQWARTTPAAAGFDRAGLDLFAERTAGVGCLVYRGRIFRDWGTQSNRGDIASIVKALYVHVLLQAVEEGRIESLDAPVAEHMRVLHKLPQGAGRNMTWRQLATQTACYGVSEAPGEAFNYSDYQMALLVDALVLHVYGSSFRTAQTDILDPLIFDPLQCEDEPRVIPSLRVRMSARDLARFGLLYLAEGRWGRRRLLSRKHARLVRDNSITKNIDRTRQNETPMLRPGRTLGSGHNLEDSMNSFGYCWWVNGIRDDGERVLPDAPPDAYGAIGHGGRHALILIPSMDLVVCWLTGLGDPTPHRFSCDGRPRVNECLRLLMAARVDDAQAFE